MVKYKGKRQERFYFNLIDLQRAGFVDNIVRIGLSEYSFWLVDQSTITDIDVRDIKFSEFHLYVKDNGLLRPTFRLISPEIRLDCPHVYPGGEICLFHPKEFSWKRGSIFGYRLVLILYTWIAFYSLWKITGNWYGEEYPHGIPKS